ncbi:hypothetical protein HK102_003079, partial [Quaeritorhiza haematococci]
MTDQTQYQHIRLQLRFKISTKLNVRGQRWASSTGSSKNSDERMQTQRKQHQHHEQANQRISDILNTQATLMEVRPDPTGRDPTLTDPAFYNDTQQKVVKAITLLHGLARDYFFTHYILNNFERFKEEINLIVVRSSGFHGQHAPDANPFYDPNNPKPKDLRPNPKDKGNNNTDTRQNNPQHPDQPRNDLMQVDQAHLRPELTAE